MKKILITGAASGIGKAVRHHFLNAGWIVGVIDRNLLDVDSHINEYRFVGDVRDNLFLLESIKTFDSLDGTFELVFCNVATACSGHFHSIPWSEHETMINTNLKSTMFLIYNCIDRLKHSQAPAVLISTSMATNHGVPLMATYSATKSALVGLAEALSLELEKKKIRCIYLNLGRFDTPMANKIRLYLEGGNNTIKSRKYTLPTLLKLLTVNRSPECVGKRIEKFYFSKSNRNIHLPHSLKYDFCFSRLVPVIHRIALRFNMIQAEKENSNNN